MTTTKYVWALLALVLFVSISDVFSAKIKLPQNPDKAIRNVNMKAVRAMVNSSLYEGDIWLRRPKSKIDNFRNAVAHDEYLWPNGVIPFTIDQDFSEDVRKMILSAMEKFPRYTCVRFREKNEDDEFFIKIFVGKGCYASIGYDPDHPEGMVSLGEGCHYPGTITHELMHVVGYYHEHNRNDRDEYLNVYYENINPSFKSEFKKLEPYNERIFTTFDYNSVMLYGPRAFSVDDKAITMSPKLPGFYMIEVYEKPGLTALDAESIKKLYKC